MAAAASRFQDLVTQTAHGALGGRGRRPEVCWSLRRRFRERNQLYVEHERALRAALLPFVSERCGNPKPSSLARDHQLNAFGPSRDHLIERECRRLAGWQGAIEHLAVGRPPRVVYRSEERRVGK